ncbi:MAG: transglutaminase-like putative cysteine protease [Crocinitomicaceae bacterium]|jgi:transglutaminase-like putative cysteine protease
MQNYLTKTWFLDLEDVKLLDFSNRFVQQSMTRKQKAVSLYYGVRDGIAYNPYTYSPVQETFKASNCVWQSQSYCIPKAILLVALARLNAIPARLGLADVQNHLASPALLEWLKNDEFVMHGYAEMYIDGKWVKATPAFDKRLCRVMKVSPLEFNGEDDSVFHEFNGEGQKSMEYLREHGHFEDVPYKLIIESVAAAYPHLVDEYKNKASQSLEADLSDAK